MNEQVIHDALMLSSGTICTLTGEPRYVEIEKIQTAFVVWLQKSEQKFESWVDAWNLYRDTQ